MFEVELNWDYHCPIVCVTGLKTDPLVAIHRYTHSVEIHSLMFTIFYDFIDQK